MGQAMAEKSVILIVEDDEKSRRLIRDVLNHQGYETLETDRGEEALDLMRAHHPDLVLLDILLPGMSGLDTVREIRNDAGIADTPVIAVTASVMDNDRDKIRAAGFDAFEPKPLNLRAFLETVRSFAQPAPS
jgi:two-component system cell cycle response regulator DivK